MTTPDSLSVEGSASDVSLSDLLAELAEDNNGVTESLTRLISYLRDETRPHMFGLLNMRLSVVASVITHQREPTLRFSDQKFLSIKNEVLQRLQDAIARENGGEALVQGITVSEQAEKRARAELMHFQGNR